jgi:glycine betaine transporter
MNDTTESISRAARRAEDDSERCLSELSNGTTPRLAKPPVREILAPVDFSAHSTAPLQYAIRLANQVGAKITLLHVIKPALTSPEVGWYPSIESTDKIAQIAENAVTCICAREKLTPPLSGPTIIRVGVPWEIIKETARDLNIDLILITTHGRTGLAHALLGSSAEKIIRQAPCPVLVVPMTEYGARKDDLSIDGSPVGQCTET